MLKFQLSTSRVVLAGVLLIPGAPVQAQEDPAPTAARDTDIVVTAQKRAQSVQEIAASISAIDGTELENRGITDVTDLQFAVPGLDVGTLRIGGTNITIRGVGLNQGSPGVAVHVDGIYQTDSSMADLAQADLARVEVLRGPQGTLYGRNANGGVINFISRRPTDRFEGEVTASYREFAEGHLAGKLNVPVRDGVRARLVIDYGNRDHGFIRNVAGGQDLDGYERISGRLLVDVDLGTNANMELSASAAHESGPTSFFQLRTLPSALALASNPFLATANFSLKPWTTTANDPNETDRDFYQLSGTLNWDIGFADLKSITSYTYYQDRLLTDSDGSDISAFLQTNRDESRAITQEFNLSSVGAGIDWVLGAYYLGQRADRTLAFNFPLGFGALPPGAYLSNDASRRDADVYAVFGDATMHVTEKLDLIAGARYSREKQSYRYKGEIGLLVGGNRIPLISTCPAREDDPDFSSFTPRGGLQYKFSEAHNVYATVSRGFKAGGVNLNACGNIFNPEKITAYEAGYRGTWLDRRMTFNLTGFHYDYTDLQLSQVTGLTNLVTNAGAASMWGVEVEVAYNPDDNLSIGGNLSWLDAKFTSFQNLDTLNPAAGVQNLDGSRLSNAPRWSANFNAAVSTDPGPSGRFTLRGELSLRSSVYFREFNTALDRQGGYAVVGASLAWEDPSERYQLRLFGSNLFNKAYIAQGGSGDAIGTLAITYGAPRQIGIEARAHF